MALDSLDRLPHDVCSTIPVSLEDDTTLPMQTAELLCRARSGDGVAVNELLTRYVPRVRGLVAMRMGQTLVDLVEQDDLVQEALMTAYDGLGRFESRSEGGFICWLATIVQSRVENARRAARADKRGGGAVRRSSDLGDSTIRGLPPANGPSPSEAVMACERDPVLERALLTLPDKQRQIVYCRLVLEMSFAEIAVALAVDNVDSVRAQFHKATAQLRDRLGDAST
jgi:RNA polymerase sigma-70 factor, ECF subfamily